MEFDNINQKNIFEAGPVTVAQFIDQLNRLVKPVSVKIIGEVSEAKVGPTGHMYFSMKDEKNAAVMSCAIWRSRYEMFGIQLKIGMKIIASGHAEIYAPSGRLSFICDSVELAGEGALKKEYDRLLAKLTNEGIFAIEKKRAVPKFARRIGIITSKQGAVIHDFLNNIGKFGFQIEFIDSRVEGQLAVGDLLASIQTFKKREIDVLVIMRGGGSLEAMMAFNNETIVREIAAFPVPVIAGIGHDKDVPLAAMAADVMTSTPTAAANLLTQSWQEIFRALDRYENAIIGGYKNELTQARSRLRQYAGILSNFRYILQNITRKINAVMENSVLSIKNRLLSINQQISYLRNIIESHNPERQLKLGYSIAKINGKILKSARNARPGDDLDIILADGMINSKATNIKLHGNKKENRQPERQFKTTG
ncbi:MAG: exodeoxyribonuclease VII large subunit [Candidatus Nealsonbacteria bacterium DGGOD1a]|jgi:exodeoxyribonuclease VII, large subunit|nr:MAG: exodeoxyribonuclease VII large subunit [Candidatus Nealsonbacteria bacterium DGGOD1a]